MKGAGWLISILACAFFLVTAVINYTASDAQKIEMKAVLDRFEGDQAVLLMEHWNEEIVVPRKNLPEDSEKNMWFLMKKKNEEYQVVSVDYETSKIETEKARKLMDSLKQKDASLHEK